MIQPLFRNVLIMVNGTDASINAVKYAILMAKLYHCRVFAVYVVDIATIRMLTLNRIFIDEESREYEQSLEENGKRYLSYVEGLGKEKGVKIETELRRGAIWSEIIASSEEHKIDTILVGGNDNDISDQKSVSMTFKSVLIHARCSVLVVKERMIEQLYRLA